MIDLDQELTDHAREWRATQAPLPPLVVEHRVTTRRRSRWVLVAAALLVVIALGAVVFALTRPESSTPPSVDTPTTTRPGFVPQLDVVPLYLPIDAADIAAAAGVLERVTSRIAGDPPSRRSIVQSRACAIAMLGVPNGRLFNFEDPASYVGPPVTPSVAAPDPPPTRRCTGDAARAAARIREIVGPFDWFRTIEATDGDDVVHAAKVQDVACLTERGIQGVDASRIPDPAGSSQAHPEWNSHIQTFVDCFAPVAAARVPVRQAFRDRFLADHGDQIASLQRAFDDYLRAVYAPSPHAKTVTTQPDLARYDGGCIRVTEVIEVPPATAPLVANTLDDAVALARGAVRDLSASPVRPNLGAVSVCDRASIRPRLAWTFELAGEVVVVDARTGKVLVHRRPRTGS